MSNVNFRRWFKILLVNILVFAVLCEGGAYLAYPLVFNESLDRIALQKRLDRESDTQRTEALHESVAWISNKSVHPYTGFAYREILFDIDEARSEASPDRVVVALIGGSVALGLYREAHAEFEAALQEYEAFFGKEIVILPMAMGGFKQPQQLMALAYYLVEDFHFDYVVNLDGFNEIVLPVHENKPNGIALSFPRAWHRFLLDAYDTDVLDAILEIRARRNGREEIRSLFSHNVIRSSAFFLFAWRVLDDRLNSKISELNADLLANDERSDLPDYVRGPAKDYADDSAAVVDAARIWKNASREMAALCEAAGIRYLHFLQPNQYVPGSKTLNDEERATAYLGEDSVNYRLVSYGYPLLSEAGLQLKSEGVDFHDLTNLYRDESQTIYADDCCHMNEIGYNIMAREIARRMGE